MERKQGVTNLERMCEEIEEEERIKEQRKELKRQKKKRKKALAKSERENLAHQTEQEASHCEVSHGVQGGLRRGGSVWVSQAAVTLTDSFGCITTNKAPARSPPMSSCSCSQCWNNEMRRLTCPLVFQALRRDPLGGTWVRKKLALGGAIETPFF